MPEESRIGSIEKFLRGIVYTSPITVMAFTTTLVFLLGGSYADSKNFRKEKGRDRLSAPHKIERSLPQQQKEPEKKDSSQVKESAALLDFRQRTAMASRRMPNARRDSPPPQNINGNLAHLQRTACR